MPKFEDIKPLKIQWIIDLHCKGNNGYIDLSKNFDIILHSTNCLIDGYRKILPNKKHIWFPNGVDSRYFNSKFSIKTNDLMFIGSKSSNRQAFIDRLSNELGLIQKFATGIDMIENISFCKIHFNKNMSCDINYRTFETIGLGTCLITDYDEDLLKLGFVDNNNCLLYKNYEEAKNKIVNSLKNGSWKEIGEKGYELSKINTYIKRIENLLKEIYG